MFKPDREKGFAKAALDLMGECAVVSTPENFELFYAHVSGENPAITQIMGAAIAAKKPFTAELLQDLRLRCLSGARAALAMDAVGSNMSAVIGDVLGKLEASVRDTADYKKTLSAASGELEGSPADIRKLVEGLIAATREMEQRAKKPGRRTAGLVRAGERAARQTGQCPQGKPDRSAHQHRQPQSVRRCGQVSDRSGAA